MANPAFDTALVQAIGLALVHFVWQGTAIGAATALALHASRGARPATRYLIACAGFALMAIAPLLSILGFPFTGSVEMARAAAPALSVPSAAVLEWGRFLPIAVAIWLTGVLVLSVRLLAACVGIERLKRHTKAIDADITARATALAQRLGLSRSVRVFESTLVTVPTVVGYMRPVILLPASVITGLPAAYLDTVLVHELAHVRRHDYLVNALQTVVETLLFYHPAVWWCSRQIRVEREHCCDDMVVEAYGDRVAYATALTRLEELKGLHPMLSLNASGGRLIDRIRRLLTHTPASDGRSTMWAIAGSLMAVVIAITLTPVFLAADAPRIDAADDQVVLPSLPSPPPAFPIAPEPPSPPPVPAEDLDEVFSTALNQVTERREFADALRREVEGALKKLAEETGGLFVESQAPEPPAAPAPPAPAAAPAPVPAPPAPAAAPAPAPLPAPGGWPAAPSAPAPPTPSRAPAAPSSAPRPGSAAPAPAPRVAPVRPAAPAPPLPPTSAVDLDPDSLEQVMQRATQQLFEGFEQLRHATEDINAKQQALVEAQAELQKMRIDSLSTKAQLDAVRAAVEELSAKSGALRSSQIDVSELQKQLDSIRKALGDLKPR